jgi:hypothetical protein
LEPYCSIRDRCLELKVCSGYCMHNTQKVRTSITVFLIRTSWWNFANRAASFSSPL